MRHRKEAEVPSADCVDVNRPERVCGERVGGRIGMCALYISIPSSHGPSLAIVSETSSAGEARTKWEMEGNDLRGRSRDKQQHSEP